MWTCFFFLQHSGSVLTHLTQMQWIIGQTAIYAFIQTTLELRGISEPFNAAGYLQSHLTFKSTWPQWLWGKKVFNCTVWSAQESVSEQVPEVERAGKERRLTQSLAFKPVYHISHRGYEVLVLLWVGHNNTVQSVHVGIDGLQCGCLPTT